MNGVKEFRGFVRYSEGLSHCHGHCGVQGQYGSMRKNKSKKKTALKQKHTLALCKSEKVKLVLKDFSLSLFSLLTRALWRKKPCIIQTSKSQFGVNQQKSRGTCFCLSLKNTHYSKSLNLKSLNW